MSKRKNIIDNLAKQQNFGERLHQVLGGGSYSEITRILDEGGVKIDYDSLRRYILEERKPDIDTLITLADFAEVSVDWLLRGNDSDERILNSQKIGEMCKELEDSIWNELLLGDLRALKKLAERNKKTLQQTVREVIVQNLSIHGVLEKLFALNFISLSDYSKDELCEVDLLGEIGEGEELVKIYETVQIPKKLISDVSEETGKSLNKRSIRAYRIISKHPVSQGVQAGDIIVAANYKKIAVENRWFYDSLGFVIPVNERKVILRRVYEDILTGHGFLACPLHTPHPIEKLGSIQPEDFEFILAIVTP